MTDGEGYGGHWAYPDWICLDCALRAEPEVRRHNPYPTWRPGRCDICTQGKAVAHPGDFGYPKRFPKPLKRS